MQSRNVKELSPIRETGTNNSYLNIQSIVRNLKTQMLAKTMASVFKRKWKDALHVEIKIILKGTALKANKNPQKVALLCLEVQSPNSNSFSINLFQETQTGDPLGPYKATGVILLFHKTLIIILVILFKQLNFPLPSSSPFKSTCRTFWTSASTN